MVDVHGCIYIISIYTHAWISNAYSTTKVSYDLKERISRAEIRVFFMEIQQLIKTLFFHFRTLILYGLIGGFCAGLDFGVYTLLCHFDILPYLWANVISIHCGIICSFFLNRGVNFKVKDKPWLRFLSFYAIGLIGLGISELMLYLMVSIAGLNEIVCKLISIVVVALVQYVLNKYITFKSK